MATARTMRDRLGTPGGAICGYNPDVPHGLIPAPQMSVRSSVPGLLLASAWAGFGGYTGAMAAGASAAQAALRVGGR